MKRWLIVGFVLLTMSFFLSWCSWKKTTTVTNSVVPVVDSEWTLREMAEDDLLPSVVKWTKSITFDGTNVQIQDDGMREVFVSSTETGDLAKEVFAWLTKGENPEEKTQLSVKQATVTVEWSVVVIPNGSWLLDHLVGYNVTIKSSWDDLVLQADLKTAPYESYVVVDANLPENYLVANPRDRFGDAIYMIPQGAASLLRFDRWSDVQAFSLSYLTGTQASGFAEFYLAWWWAYGMEKSYIHSEEIMVAEGARLRLGWTYAPVRNSAVYHVVFDEKTKTIAAGVENITFPKEKEHLLAYATQQWYGVRWFTPLTRTASGYWEMVTRNDKEQALFVVEDAYSYLIPLHNYPFVVELQKDASDEYRPYFSRLLTTHLLDDQKIMDELTKLFGEKNYRYDSREKWFAYEIQPKKVYSWTLTVANIYGESVRLPVSYLIDKIDQKAVVKELVANTTISVLPRSGSFKDVLIQYTNIPSFPVSFQACTLAPTLDLLGAYKWVGVENYLFTCTGPVVTQEVKPDEKEFVYRKAYRTPLPIPETLSGASAFKVFFTDQFGKEVAHYMLKSDIGLWTKITDDQLRVRWFNLSDGQPAQEGTVKVTNLMGMTMGSAELKNGTAKISLPKRNDTYDYSTERKKNIYLVEMTSGKERTFVVAHRDGRGDLSVPMLEVNGNERYLKLNSKLEISEVTSSTSQINQGGMVDPMKIYGYTDRGLYKAGETINFAGWVRNVLRFDDLQYLKDATVSVTISNPLGGEPVLLDKIPLDAFGWFVGSYTLPSTLPLGDYFVEYRLNENVAYTHNVKVEEYQKPTFFVDITHQTTQDTVSLVMEPAYFFGSPLKEYDMQVNRSLVGKDICRYCRWWNESNYYFNHVFNDSLSTWGKFTVYNQTADRLVYPLYDAQLQAHKGYEYTLKVDMIVKDRLSDETQFITKHIDFKPEVMLGLSGQPYEWLYRDKIAKDPRAWWKIEGVVQQGKQDIQTMRYEVYYLTYDRDLQQWVDGNFYYVNGESYLQVGSGDIAVRDMFVLSGDRIDAPGEYFLRVFAEDSAGQVIGEVQKRISRYTSGEWDKERDLLGAVPNNYTLTVDIPKKTYKEGEEMPINIAPYQRDAWVVVTIERGQYIVDSFLKKLDGNALTIPVKKGYAPNVIVNVMMLQGTQMNNSVRQEPRFFAGYAEAKIDVAMHKLNIAIVPQKAVYAPGEQVTLDIMTTDSAGKPVDARISVAVVDQALASLFSLVKEPIPYFFNTVGTSVFTYTNMKLLYQSLKAFATWGVKWWSGQWGKAMFSYIREDLKDAAFWSGAVYTKWGTAQITFTAPENLTTWLVDVIGITQDTRLGTATTWFVVKKDLIIEPNAPLFVTLGDSLKVPVKVLVPDGSWWGKVRGSAWLENQQGERLELGTFSVAPNKTVGVDLAIPLSWWTSNYVTLSVEWTYWTTKDGIKLTIPLRSEGLLSKDSVGVINTAWSHSFTFPKSLTQSLSVRLAQLPTNFIEPVAAYLIHYPYGCTEQLLSSLLPLAAIEQLRTTWVFSSALLSWDTVITESWPVEISKALRDGLAKLLTHQRPDGGFGYWPDSSEAATQTTYVLSAWVYAAGELLNDIPELSWSLAVPMQRLEEFLWTNRDLSPEGWYRYLLTKVDAWKPLTDEERATLQKISPQQTGYLPLLRYLIAVAEKDEAAIKTWRLVAKIPTNGDAWNQYSVFLNPISATAMKLRALVDDPLATQQERSDLLLSLIKQREKSGLRGYSTQANVQVLLTLKKLATFRIPKSTIACTVTVDGKQYTLAVPSAGTWIDMALSGTSATVDRSCDSVLLADVTVRYLPEDLNTLVWTNSHVSNMNWSISDPTAKVGQTVDIVGSFATDVAGEQVAVELFVPSDYKLLEVISSKMTSAVSDPYMYGYTPEETPFAVSDPHCQPTHREARFDRLFLYYDILEPGVCDISIPALKAYSGTTTIMPMRVREMYRGMVNGRKVIVR